MTAPPFPRSVPLAARLLPAPLVTALMAQDMLATRQMLLDAGITRSCLDWHLGRHWTSPLPGVVLIGDADLSEHQRIRAALLYAGPRALAAGPTAAALHGLHPDPTGVVHLLVPRDCAARRERWVQVHRSNVPEHRSTVRAGLAVTGPERSVLDAARWSRSNRAADALVIEACQRRLVTPERLARELSRFGHAPGTARVRRALAAAEAGAWSVAESDLHRLVLDSAALPDPWLNPVLTTRAGRRLTSPDLWFDDARLAVMVHSKAHHRDGDDWEHTVSSDADLSLAGVTVLGITPTFITRDPAAALRRVEDAYRAAMARPRTADVVAVPRTPA